MLKCNKCDHAEKVVKYGGYYFICKIGINNCPYDKPSGEFKDENGVTRHAMTYEQLEKLYKQLDEFIADCTVAEYERNKDHFIAIKTLIHQRKFFTK